ncbi:MAG: (d)CMP kinase [Thermoleophilia bacterium]|jgi:cytidylate kinase
MIVAIDGPAGAGKSTIARMIAARRGWTYLDTGAMYRTVTLLALEQDIPPGASDELGQLSQNIEMNFKPGPDGSPRVFAGCREVTEEIRSPRVTANVSEVSAQAPVREAMVEMQRALTSIGDVVVDGRDIGTVVCPNAEVKIFLTASNSERARRRRLELEAKGIEVPQERMEQEISARDEYDSSRKVSPLKAADDAVHVDTTDLGIYAVVDRVMEIIDAKSD